MRDILKLYSGTQSGTPVSVIKNLKNSYFLMRGRKTKNGFSSKISLILAKLSKVRVTSNFFIQQGVENPSLMFDRFKKKSDETESGGSEMVEERPSEQESSFSTESTAQDEPSVESHPEQSSGYSSQSSSDSQIGISKLMDKRVKLEEAIDYVGLMIKNLKDKRTKLEKEIEDESVDIKNLKEKLMKVNEYIEEENQGIQNLTKKRSAVENEADEVGSLINNLKTKLSGIDSVVNSEGDKIKSFKDSRPQP